MQKSSLIFVFAIGLNSSAQEINIIPQPVSIVAGAGTFSITKKTVIAVRDDGDKKTADFLNSYLQKYYGFTLDVDKQESKDYIRLTTKKFIRAPEHDSYSLNVSAAGITIEGDTYAGTFHGMQSLVQLLPVIVSKETGISPPVRTRAIAIPFITIHDAPRFKYRGMHLDVGRHFFPVDYIKKYIDYIALHKMNYFHWHLTEDQGWRIEIKKYPRLAETGGCRNGTIIGRYPGKGNDNTNYCGYYTQDEVKEVVQYAADRHITVIPEIEMPGHSSAAIAAYPWLSCFPDEPTKIPPNMISEASKNSQGKLVQETWGIFDDVFCAGRDSTFSFLQNVIDEVLALFPSKYIHVGGDECPKNNWKRCPFCQQRIKDEKLKDEHELQSYFIQRMEKYLNDKGRTLIGWDEILEGGLAPNAVVMSWRGEAGGIAAAKQNHQVVMTPATHVYLNYSQKAKEDSVTIGGLLTLEKVYSYDPVPKELNSTQAKQILGAQGNLWTEYIKNVGILEYMLFPRMSALSEVLWSQKNKKDARNFEKRLRTQFRRYDLWNANYSRAYFDLKASVLPTKDYNGILVKLETKGNGKIRYIKGTSGNVSNEVKETDGIQYTQPLVLKSSDNLEAYYFDNNLLKSIVAQKFIFSKATGKKITLTQPPMKDYPGDGAFTLVNGILNEKGLSVSKEILGFTEKDCEAMIDLGKTQTISNVIVHALGQGGSRVYPPKFVEISTSADGKKFIFRNKAEEFVNVSATNGTITVSFDPVPARYVKVLIKNMGKVPEGKPATGNPVLMLIDEIEVN